MLTFDEYAKTGGYSNCIRVNPRRGCRCPFCKSDEKIHVGDTGFDGPIGWSVTSCGQCGAEWTDEYEMVRVTYNDGTENL
jgi:C4-type Zn-finger protein